MRQEAKNATEAIQASSPPKSTTTAMSGFLANGFAPPQPQVPTPEHNVTKSLQEAATAPPSLDEISKLEELLAQKKRLLGGGSPALVMASAPALVKLDLACGKSHEAHATKVDGCTLCSGFEGADIADLRGIKYPRTNLLRFPWPWQDDSVDELWCSHFLEHIPMGYWNPEAGTVTLIPEEPGSQDLLFKFLDECWRILKHDGVFTAIVPAGTSTRALQDPTHRRFIVPDTFLYFNRDWRVVNNLDHYGVRCHFGVNVNHTTPKDETLYHPEASARRFRHFWNVVFDHVAQLKAIKK
jgi:hypothetical protein